MNIDIVQDIKPLSTFKRNAAEIIAKVKETKRPTIITINGNADVVLVDSQSYQEKINALEYWANVMKIKSAIAEADAGKGIPFDKFWKNFYAEKGLSNAAV